MTANRRNVLILALLTLAVPVQAAEPSRDLTTMRAQVGKVIYVKTVDGIEREGRFVRASSQQLTIAPPNGLELSLPADQIAEVWARGDRLRNGVIIGAIFGALSAVVGMAGCVDCAEVMTIGVVVDVPFWAGVGALIDRVHVGRTLIYQAP